MQKESILKTANIIIEALDQSDIENKDKIELMLNINYFLTHYEEITKSKVTSKKKINMIENDRKFVR